MMFSSDVPYEGCSAAAQAILSQLFQSGQSEDYGVADTLNLIASNGDEQQSDEHLATCAEQIIEAALAVIAAVAPSAPAAYVKGEDVRAELKEASTYLGGLDTLELVARRLDLAPLNDEDDLDKDADEEDERLP